MSKIVAVHSYKGGTGKTIMSVNLAATFAKQGKKVALFDLDFRAPSLFAILRCEKIQVWLNDYLNNNCDIDKILIDLSSRISGKGKLYVGLANPSIDAMRDISTKDRRWEMRALGHLLSLKNKLFDEQKFDYIIFDTSPGLQYSSMNAIVTADFVVVTTTGDCSDVNGTKRMISEFYKMFEKKTGIVINKILDDVARSNNAEYAKKIKETYNVPLLGVVPCFCEILKAEGKYLFPQDKSDHPFTNLLYEMADKIEKSNIN
ncbi:MAG: MinD/ParA family protein [Nitrososphaerota archaeon]|jgi:septum site-determining protein MinD|nr:MinD/ParA family protein [Nitrososphaerota archaeon]